jgi:hypothetical protein
MRTQYALMAYVLRTAVLNISDFYSWRRVDWLVSDVRSLQPPSSMFMQSGNRCIHSDDGSSKLLRNRANFCQYTTPSYPSVANFHSSQRAGRFGDRIPVGVRFSASYQTGPGVPLASYTVATGSFPGVKLPGLDFDYPPDSSAEVKERVELYLYSHSGLSWPVIGWTLLSRVICYQTSAAFS